jgi:NTE family protein
MQPHRRSGSIQAYAILEGGGAKGIALAGALQAAENAGLTFAGYAGTSAGSIIALLSVVGYSPDEIRDLLVSNEFEPLFLGDAAPYVRAYRQGGFLRLAWFRHWPMSIRLAMRLGLADAQKFKDFLLERMQVKLPRLKNLRDVKFSDLNGCPRLKVIASHLGRREAKIYGPTETPDASVIDAVRASMSYPFVFRPVREGSFYLVDGGLVTNLPIYLFEKERGSTGLPVYAFDIVTKPQVRNGKYGFFRFCSDMLATALEGSERIQQHLLAASYKHVPIDTEDTDTLDFAMSVDAREHLFALGLSEARSFFESIDLADADASRLTREEAIKRSRAPDDLVEPVLSWFRNLLTRGTDAEGVRTYVMLPSGDGKHFEIIYRVAMDRHTDEDLRLPFYHGFMGIAWEEGKTVLGSWTDARREPGIARITEDELSRLRPDRRTVLAAPIYHPTKGKAPMPGVRDILGVVVADTETELAESGWGEDDRWAERQIRLLADVVAKILN